MQISQDLAIDVIKPAQKLVIFDEVFACLDSKKSRWYYLKYRIETYMTSIKEAALRYDFALQL